MCLLAITLSSDSLFKKFCIREVSIVSVLETIETCYIKNFYIGVDA